jgi:hypothetical protein
MDHRSANIKSYLISLHGPFNKLFCKAGRFRNIANRRQGIPFIFFVLSISRTLYGNDQHSRESGNIAECNCETCDP